MKTLDREVLKKVIPLQDRLESGHRSCRGCVAVPLAARHVLRAIEGPVVVACATGCMEVTTSIYPETSWNVPWIHNTFENVAATLSGVEASYNVLKKKGKISKETTFVAFGGDGGTYDIGLQSLSGMLERGHNILYVCYDNEGYMNTGNQRSSATPQGAITTTTPAGKKVPGKKRRRKDLTEVVAGHDIEYVAQSNIAYQQDVYNKVKKALTYKGPKFINIYAPCILGWKVQSDMGLEVARLATESHFWPLYEVEQGQYKMTYKPEKQASFDEYLKLQGRFKHLAKPENKKLVQEMKDNIDQKYQYLFKKCDCLGAE
ncbi:pyruvate ferredoxin oxidoreductase [Patescibacteria group bacterium]|nr:pyruvate ferredoxin oxidoreductase [Patescibacteria group bacterium]